MRRLWGPLLAVALVFASDAYGAPKAPEQRSDELALHGTPLLTPSATWRWQVIRAPHLAPQIGAHAISALDVVAGRRAIPIDVLGQGVAPTRWPLDLDGPGVPTLPPSSDTERIAAAFGITTFTLDAAMQGMEMLELRVRYEDGLVVWLNGIEVARSALLRSAAATALAVRPHGPEWETFYIPVAPALLRLGDNTLAFELHPSGRRDALSLAAELSARRDRGIVRGPVLSDVTAASARVSVDTDPNTEAVLVWGTSALDRRIVSAAGKHHEFSLAPLPTSGAVHYRVHAGAMQSAEHVFHTVPAAGSTIRIGIYGDVRGGHTTHRKLVEQMFDEPLDLVAVTGDMVLRGADAADWQRFFAITEPLLGAVTYLTAIGNHDLGITNALFATPPGPPGRPPNTYWYSYDLADIHLVFLDSNAYEARVQEAWLEADLTAARARKVRAILAFTHDGPYSRGNHRGNLDARTRYAPILVRHGVDMVFSGHDHLYQRGEQDGLRYIVTGGGGASLYSASCGVSGKRACPSPDGMIKLAKVHHYLIATITATTLEVCPRKVDGRLIEPCVRFPLHH